MVEKKEPVEISIPSKVRIHPFVDAVLDCYKIFLTWLFLKFHSLILPNFVSINRGPKFNNKLLIIGDDTAAGTSDKFAFGQIHGIARYFSAAIQKNMTIKQTWRFYNLGIDNSTSRDWLPGGKHFKSVRKHKDAKFALVFLGYNDGRNQNKIKPEETIENIRAILKELEVMNIKPYICTIPTVHEYLVYDLYGDNITRNDFIKTLPNHLSIDGFNYEYKGKFLYHQDQKHFNEKGYAKIAKDLADLMGNELIKVEFNQFMKCLSPSK
ncbi:hypothetical protein HDV06_004561 [Boothiomyces sp. JEL0866]|nr:hypothetical protein HDV06_004561 [Boothiomyces sp. JEL0866]